MLQLKSLDRKMPPQNMDLLMKHLYRFDKVFTLQNEAWAPENALCVDFYEGRQWDPKDAAKLLREGRPAGTFNKIKRLVNLILGYQAQQKYESKVSADNDNAADDTVADVLSHLLKNILDDNEYTFIESQVFLDGLLGGRGYFDVRLDFLTNIFGNVKVDCLDPASVYPDPDADKYDPATWNYVFISRWMSIEDIAMMFGTEAANTAQVSPGISSVFPTMSSGASGDDISPPRMFGLYSWISQGANFPDWLGGTYISGNYYDKGAKLVRVLEQQHYELTWIRYFVDMNTGQMSEIPAQWDAARIQKVVDWANVKGGNIDTIKRAEKRVRWTYTAGDQILYDDWSPYEYFTVVPYFQYFRRGKTRGFVADLIDPQREINKRRSAQIHIIGTTAYNGWWYEEGSLDIRTERLLKSKGSSPGFVGKYKKGSKPPEKIEQSPPPQAMERLEEKSSDDLKEISGVNDSALGEVDIVQSGVAVENRQKQTIVGLEPILQNMNYTRNLVAKRILSIVQRYYSEQRMVKVIGIDGAISRETINQVNAIGEIANDVTVGKYKTTIVNVPASDTYMSRQFNELLDMVKTGVVPPALAADLLIQFSSAPDKEILRQRFLQAFQNGAVPPAAQSGNTQSSPAPAPTSQVAA